MTHYRAYAGQLVPHLVFASDEATLTSISELLGSPLPALLESTLPSSMVLILTCWAQEGEGDQGRVQATAGHNLLCKYMSKEVRFTKVATT